KYDPTTCHCALCSPMTGSYLSSDGFTCFRPIPYCKDQKEGVCEACKSGYALSDDKLSCIAQ
ncbi:MAG: hypothetical protein PUH03_04085, partial [bacterium]|nr:hypothetical protein [bacterium]